MEYVCCDTTNKDFIALAACLDAELAQRYGSKQQAAHRQHNQVEKAEAVIATMNGLPVACGCFRAYDGVTAEIKRMYVQPGYRGKGIAGEVLLRLERRAADLGYREAVLETGRLQPEAIRLYEKNGYARVPGYGSYKDEPDSVCFRKTIVKGQSE